jgi:hypothetical protein
MAQRELLVDHTTIWRWTQTYGPVGTWTLALAGQNIKLILSGARQRY